MTNVDLDLHDGEQVLWSGAPDPAWVWRARRAHMVLAAFTVLAFVTTGGLVGLNAARVAAEGRLASPSMLGWWIAALACIGITDLGLRSLANARKIGAHAYTITDRRIVVGGADGERATFAGRPFWELHLTRSHGAWRLLATGGEDDDRAMVLEGLNDPARPRRLIEHRFMKLDATLSVATS